MNDMTLGTSTEYENYKSTSKTYDDARIPLGLNILLGSFAQHPNKPLEEQRLLDAGCGTGSFLHQIAGKFKFATGFDANAGMLDQARAKLDETTNITLSAGFLPQLPFQDNSFDAIMTNQVVHHLDTHSTFSNLHQFTAEAYRALAPGGSLVIHTSSKEQVCNSFWFGWVIPEARERMASRYAPMSTILSMLEDVGFESVGSSVPLEAMYDLNVYLNPEGPFDADWRACDSMFALATEEELERGLKRLQNACEDGSVTSVIDEAEQWRLRSGQSTFISVRKR
jgi:ubiquinone/menaquinone biosynthesis C-methylase UbiE